MIRCVVFLLMFIFIMSGCGGGNGSALEDETVNLVDVYCKKLPGPPVYHQALNENSKVKGDQIDYVIHRIKYGVIIEEVRLNSLVRRKAFSCVET